MKHQRKDRRPKRRNPHAKALEEDEFAQRVDTRRGVYRRSKARDDVHRMLREGDFDDD